MLTQELQLIDVLHKIITTVEAEFLYSSFTNTISQAGDLGWMPPLKSIQSAPHLFRYNYLLSPRFVAVLPRGMRLNACSRYTEREVLSSIDRYWNN